MESKLSLSPLDAFLDSTFMLPPPIEERLFDMLAFLRAFAMDSPARSVVDGSSERFKSMAREAASIISNLDLNKIGRFKGNKLMRKLDSDRFLRMWITSIEMEFSFDTSRSWLWTIYDRYRLLSFNSLTYYFPTAAQLVFVDHLVEYLTVLLKDKSHSLGPLKREIFQLQRKLKLVSFRLTKIPEPLTEEEHDVQSLIKSITELSYEIEYVIDSTIAGDHPIWQSKLRLGGCLTRFQGFDIDTKLKMFPYVNNTEIQINKEFIAEGIIDRGRDESMICCTSSAWSKLQKRSF